MVAKSRNPQAAPSATTADRSAPEGDGAPGRERRRDAQRQAIEEAALALLNEAGPEAVTSRAVSAAAGVQAMSIYRLYGDMDGLVAQAAARGFAEYVEAKTGRVRRDDPVDDLRAGWDLHVGFGLDHPYVYAQIYGRHTPGHTNPATVEADAILRQLLQRVAEGGRLTRDVETAALMIHSAGCGVTFTLMALPPDQRDMAISDLCREAMLAAVTVSPGETAEGEGAAEDTATTSSGTAEATRHAVALAAVLSGSSDGQAPFTDAERGLLDEWLKRLS